MSVLIRLFAMRHSPVVKCTVESMAVVHLIMVHVAKMVFIVVLMAPSVWLQEIVR